MSRRRLLLLAVVLPLAGCGSAADEISDGPGPAPFVLPVGKADLPVGPGEVRSPDGFTPRVTMKLAGKWTSVHRDTDAFDLGQPDPKRDAPLVAVVIARPDRTAAAELADIGRKARSVGAHVMSGQLPLAGTTASYLDLRNGSGQVFGSAVGTIALDAAPKQRLRAIVTELAGEPIVALVLVPDATRWSAAWPDARALLATMRAG